MKEIGYPGSSKRTAKMFSTQMIKIASGAISSRNALLQGSASNSS